MFARNVVFSLLLFTIIYNCNAHGPGKKNPDLNEVLFSGDFDYIDLTHPFNEKTIYWPTVINFTFINQIAEYQEDGSWYAQNDFCAGEHGGTHMDAPYHFYRDGPSVGDLPLSRLIARLVIIDISDQVNGNADFVLYKRHLNLSKLNKRFNNKKQPHIVLFRFGWSKYFSNRNRYLGINYEDNTLNFPSISPEIAEWVLTHKNIVGLGIDVASADPGAAKVYASHKLLLGAGLYVLENVNLKELVPETSCTAFVFPMKIDGGTGAPLRLSAICPK